MLANSSSWSSFFRGYWCSNVKISTGQEKEKPARSASSLSSNSGANKPFSPYKSSLSLAESNLHAFTFVEIKTVTRNYSNSNFIGTGEFGPVYKGFIPDKLRPGLEAQHVAVKYLVRDGCQGPGHREWLSEIVYLGQLRHPNLVKLIGYCCEEDHRMLVYEYMPCGNLENHLFRSVLDSLTWSQRMKIAVHAAKGLAFLHEAEKSIIYRDFKSSNILLDSDYKAKLSDFGLAKEGPPEYGCRSRSTRILGTHGYASPEYIMKDHLTAKSNVYSFGVVLLEILTGRRAVDKQRRPREQNLVEWARPFLKKPNKLHRIMDSNIEYSRKAAQKAAFVAYECLSGQPEKRPDMRDVVNALEPLLEIVDSPIV